MRVYVVAIGTLVLIVAALFCFNFFVRKSPEALPEQTGAAIPAEDAGLMTTDVVVGSGLPLEADHPLTVKVTYTGTYSDGTPFDMTHAQEPYYVLLNASTTPLGWSEGLKGMQVGGTRIITIYPNYAGRAGLTQYPATSTLVYAIQLQALVEVDVDEPFIPPANVPPVPKSI